MDLDKIDRLIAEKVMELHREESGDFPNIWFNDKNNPMFFVQKFYPTRDISQAWMVVEKLIKEKSAFNLFWHEEEEKQYWECHFCLDGENLAMAWNKSAPLAICRAALKAKGIDYGYT